MAISNSSVPLMLAVEMSSIGIHAMVVRNVWSAASASDASREHYPKAVQVNITAALDSDSAGMSKRAICAGLPFDTSCSSSCLCTNLLLALEPIKCCPLTQNELEPTGWLVLFCLTLAHLTHVSVLRLFGVCVVKRGSGQDARLHRSPIPMV